MDLYQSFGADYANLSCVSGDRAIFPQEKLAEREGFEPSKHFWRLQTFQVCAFNHSATSPLVAPLT